MIANQENKSKHSTILILHSFYQKKYKWPEEEDIEEVEVEEEDSKPFKSYSIA